MKASVNKIIDGAKRRDTLGRNNVEILKSDRDIGNLLWNIGLNNSQTSGTKQTPVIVQDPDGLLYLLYYNIAKINDTVGAFGDLPMCKIAEDDLCSEMISEEKEDITND